MDYFNLGMGLFFVVSGFLVRKYPNLIAGYNTLPEHQKKNVDIDGLSSHMRNMFIVMGILIMLSNPFLAFFGLKDYGGLSFTLIVLVGTLFMLVNAQTFRDKGDDSGTKKVFRIILVIAFFGMIGIILFKLIDKGTQTPDFEVAGDQISISGMYGTSSKVIGIALMDSIPKIKRKTNGFNYGPTLKGDFELDEFGPGRLYLESKEGPFIFVKTTTKIPIIINLKSENATKELYEKLNFSLKNGTE